MELTDFKVLTFDCYGTLIDWDRGIVASLGHAGYETKGHEGELLELFGRFENQIQTALPTALYPEILSKTLEAMVKERAPEKGVPSAEEIKKFGERIGEWEPFPDSAAALKYLQQYFKLVILSNVDRESFKLSEAKLGVTFDAVITAQDVGAYKPAFNHFNKALEYIGETWGFKKHDLLHTFHSMFHDAFPANQLEITTCHIDRDPLIPGASFASPATPIKAKLDFEYHTLEDMAEAHRALLAVKEANALQSE